MRRWTLIWDIGKPLSASRSIRERSNLNRSLPRLLSMDKATQENVSAREQRINVETTNSMSPSWVSAALGPRCKRCVGLDFISETSGKKTKNKANRNRLGKRGCVPQAPDRPLRPRVPSAECSVGVSAELRHIPRIMIMYREKRSELRSTWIFGRSAKRMGTCQPCSPVVVHPMRSTSFNTRRFLCRERQRVAFENGRDPYFVDDSLVSFACVLVPLS